MLTRRNNGQKILECASPLALWRNTLEGKWESACLIKRQRIWGKAVEDYRSPKRFALPTLAHFRRETRI